MEDILESIAKEAARRRLELDSIYFYFLANQWRKGFTIIGALIGNGLQGNWGDGGRGGDEMRERILRIAFESSESAKEIRERAESEEVRNVEILLKLVDFFDCFPHNRTGDYGRAIDIVYGMGLLPSQGGRELHQKAVQFTTFRDDVQKNFGRIIVNSMRALHLKSQDIEKGNRKDHDPRGIKEIRTELKRRGELLVSFYSMIQHQLPPELNPEMTRLAVLLGSG